MKALIFENKVIQLAQDEFPVADAMEWADAPVGAEIGWIYDPQAQTLSAPVLTEAELKEGLAAYRYEIEVGGLDMGNITIQTDRASRADLLGARTKASEDSGYTVTWKTDAGFATLTAPQIIGIADAVHDHIQKCYAAEATVSAGIEDDTYTTLTEVQNAFTTEYSAL